MSGLTMLIVGHAKVCSAGKNRVFVLQRHTRTHHFLSAVRADERGESTTEHTASGFECPQKPRAVPGRQTEPKEQ